MKLRLPKLLNAAIMACMSVVTSISTTMATGALFAGVAMQQVHAEITLENDTTKLIEDRYVLSPGDRTTNTQFEFNGGTLVYGTQTDDEANKTHFSTDLSAQSSLASDYTGAVKIEVADKENTVTWDATGGNLAANSGVSAVLNSGIEKTGEGQLNIDWSSANKDTYTGNISVQGGKLSYYDNTLNKITFTGAIDVADGAHISFLSDFKDTSTGIRLTGNITGEGVFELGSTSSDNGRYEISGDNSAFNGTIRLNGSGSHEIYNATRFGSGKAFGGTGTTVEVNGRGFFFYTDNNEKITAVSDIVVLGNSAGNVLSGSMGQEIVFTGAWTVAEDAAFGATIQGPVATITVYLAGDLSGFDGTLRMPGKNTWVLGGDGVAGAGSVDMAAITGKGKLKVQYSTETVLNSVIDDGVDVFQCGSGKLIIASQNTTDGDLTVEAGKEVQLGSATTTGTWVGERLMGEGTFTLVNGTLGEITQKATGATLAVATTGTTVTVHADSTQWLDSIDLVAGGKLITDGSLSVGGDSTALTMALTTDNFGTNADALTALITASNLILTSTEGVDIQLNQADILTALNSAGDAGNVFIKLVDGTLTLAEGVNPSLLTTPGAYILGARAEATAESLAQGCIIINGNTNGIYFSDNQDGAGANKQDSITISDGRLATYSGFVINADDTLTIKTDTLVNNPNSQAGGNLVITDSASVVLSNQLRETGLVNPSSFGANNVLAGDLTAHKGTHLTITGTADSSLTVGGALSADTLVVDAGKLVAQGDATIANLSLADNAVMEVAGGQKLALTEGAIEGSLCGGKDAVLSIERELTVLGTGKITGLDVEMGENAHLALLGAMEAADLQGRRGAEIAGDNALLSLSGNGSYAGTLSGNGRLTIVAGGHLTLDNATAGAGWSIINKGKLFIDLAQSNSLTLGLLSLNSGSDTTIRLNFLARTQSPLTLGELYVDENASITLAASNSGKIAAGQYIIGTAGSYDGTDELAINFSGSAFSQLDRQNSKVYIDANGNIVLEAIEYEASPLADASPAPNAQAGAALLWDAEAPKDGELGGAYDAVLAMIDAGNNGAAGEAMAAIAGSSTAALGMALSGNVDRQLRAIRNRAAMSHSSNDAVVLNDKRGSLAQPGCYFAWVNAEGNRSQQDADSTAAGYTLTGWGATVGAGMQVNDKLTLGLALSAMYGDLQSDAPDSLKGDMDTTYVSAFAHYESGKWNHALIGTVGTMSADYTRTVRYTNGGYSTTGDTDGTVFGLMYEVSHALQLSDRSLLSPVFNISYRHTEVDNYSERGAAAALHVGKQSLDTVTVGAGARYAAVVGQQTLNRSCGFEARALVKYDCGDRQSTTDVGFVHQTTRATIESAEMGAFGVELGAGIAVPVGNGSIFADGAVELRSGYTNYNATVGYSISF